MEGGLRVALRATFFVMHLCGYRNHLLGLVLFLLELASGVSLAAVDFDHKVAPLLVRHCLECHNGF